MQASTQKLWSGYERLTEALGSLESPALLLFRAWVALAFWRAGVVKLDDPYGTSYLFNYSYHVPLLPPNIAAFLGTWIELLTPWFLGFGLLCRPVAAFLFVYNIICVISYPDLWPHGFWHGLVGHGFSDHKIWAMMLLMIIARGPGKLSIDALLLRWRARSAASRG
ncbi:MAG: DoxX family protein [Steroidobacteraceae bacterium]|nr:DoxX family protein [Steroidobacteraceae bacterium]